jgi:hypothetical protein
LANLPFTFKQLCTVLEAGLNQCLCCRKQKISSDQSSHTDDDDDDIAQIDEKQRPPPMKRGNLGKDFKIPKKKPVDLLPNPVLTGSTVVSNPLSSPLPTEKKFELVEDALEAMFADLSGTGLLEFTEMNYFFLFKQIYSL